MFSIEQKSENGFEIIVLKDAASGCFAEIIPSCGAILHSFAVPHGDSFLNIVDQHKNYTEFKNEVEAKGFKSCKLSPFVCRLKEGKYKLAEENYTIEKFYMAKHALHGLLYDVSFEIIKLDANVQQADVEMLYSYKGTDKGYPFKYDCRIIYELKKNCSLRVTTVLKNYEDFAIPVADGWHPYFGFGGKIDDLELSFQAGEMIEFDEELIPTGKNIPYSRFRELKKFGDTFYDNCFIVDFETAQPVLILRDPQKKLQLEVQPETSYPYLQFYTPHHRQSIAIENISASPDAFNNREGLKMLPGGKEQIFRTTYSIKDVV